MSIENEVVLLRRSLVPPVEVKWKTFGRGEVTGTLVDWDNGTAIIKMPDGSERAVRCD